MPRIVKLLALLAVLAPTALVAACTSVNQSLIDSYSRRLAPLLDKGNKEAVAREFGVPTGKQAVGKSELWEYMKETGAVANVAPGPRRMGGQVYGEKTFEKLTVEFDEQSILRAWRLENETGLLCRMPPAAGAAPAGGDAPKK